MFRLPLPDMSVPIASGGQTKNIMKPQGQQVQNGGAEQVGESNVFNGDQQSPHLSKVTIFASLDGDSSSTVNKTEAFGQLNQGFKAQSGIMSDSVKAQFVKQGITDVSNHLKNMYFNIAENLNVASGKKEVTSAEVDAAKSELDTNTGNLIKAEINKINTEVQNQYEQMLADAIEKSSMEQMKDDIKTGNNRMEPLFSSNMKPMQQRYIDAGIHTQPQAKEDGMNFGISGSGVKVNGQHGNTSYSIKAGTDNASVSVTRNNATIFASATTNPGYTTTSEGGKFKNANLNLGIGFNI